MSPLFKLARPALFSALSTLLATFTPGVSADAQQTTPTRRPAAGEDARPPRKPVKVNQARAESLYVSVDPEDHPPRNFERDIAAKARTDSIYAARSRGVMDFSKCRYRSKAGDIDVPAYLFAPLQKRGARGHAGMVWVHGGVHGDWSQTMLPVVKEAVQKGYVIVTPDYRGSNVTIRSSQVTPVGDVVAFGRGSRRRHVMTLPLESRPVSLRDPACTGAPSSPTDRWARLTGSGRGQLGPRPPTLIQWRSSAGAGAPASNLDARAMALARSLACWVSMSWSMARRRRPTLGGIPNH